MKRIDKLHILSAEEIAAIVSTGMICPPLKEFTDDHCERISCYNCWLAWLNEDNGEGKVSANLFDAEKIEALNIRMQRIEKRLGLLDDAEFVRVIRCRNCLHYHNNCLLSFNKTGGEKEQFCDLWNASLDPDDYCCFGKPRSE